MLQVREIKAVEGVELAPHRPGSFQKWMVLNHDYTSRRPRRSNEAITLKRASPECGGGGSYRKLEGGGGNIAGIKSGGNFVITEQQRGMGRMAGFGR